MTEYPNNELNNEINNEQPAVDIKAAKKTFSTIGIALLTAILITYAIQIVIGVIIGITGSTDSWLMTSSWGMWILSFVPLYIVGIPTGLLIMKKAPSVPLESKTMKPGAFFIALTMSICLMNIGNYIGNFLSLILSSGTAQNALNDYAMDTNPIKILVMVIIGPIIEEYVFRKQIIDRTHAYGEKTAVILSGLLFGLFHMNMFQFFYAFFLGVFLGYIYLRTGRMRYPTIIHCIINFFGSVVAPYILSLIDFEKLEAFSNMDTAAVATEELIEMMSEILPGLLALMAYSSVWGILAIIGFIMLILKRKELVWKQSSLRLPADSVASTVYMNIGIVLFIILSFALTLLSLF